MKDEFIFPEILQHEHEALRRLIKDDFPQTYEEWPDLVKKRRIEETQAGNNFKQVYIQPNEFIRYCRAIQQNHSWVSLGNFAKEKAVGNVY
jgi:hypothetical protein